jgi:phosphoribosylglycinamide formyltransferase-1
MKRRRVAVLISGRGSNLQALIDACAARDYPAEIALVISNVDDAVGLTRAGKAAIPTKIIRHKDYPNRDAFDAALDDALRHAGAEIVCLAGFMRLLGCEFVRRWEGRILNIHPSLLPEFKGLNVHERVLESGATVSGCTVHFVTAELDDGPNVVQERVKVEKGDSPETLAARVLEAEHRIYPKALRMLAEENVRLEGNNAVFGKGE